MEKHIKFSLNVKIWREKKQKSISKQNLRKLQLQSNYYYRSNKTKCTLLKRILKLQNKQKESRETKIKKRCFKDIRMSRKLLKINRMQKELNQKNLLETKCKPTSHLYQAVTPSNHLQHKTKTSRVSPLLKGLNDYSICFIYTQVII